MHKTLIVKAFEKAKNELILKGELNPSTVKIAEEISDAIDKLIGFSLGERRYRDYHKLALELKKDEERDINITQVKIVSGLCNYLGYSTYSDFKKEFDNKDKNNNSSLIKRTISTYKYYLLILAIISLAFYGYHAVNQQKWMVWQKDRYVETDFNSNSLNQGLLKLYNADRIEHFKKIDPNCDTVFFKKDGTEMLWYGKNKTGELEFFTSVGLHPETGKTLKKITKYIIKKYICESY